MIQQIALNRKEQVGHAEAIDACEEYARNDRRSATSALLRFLDESPLFQETLARLKENGQRGNDSSRG